MDWKVISEEFQCHGCGGKKHNGWKKYDAKICDDCYDEMNKITDVTSSKNDLPESETINAIDYHVQRDEQEIKGNDDII